MPQDIATDHFIVTIEMTFAPFNKYGDALRELGGTMTFNMKVKAKTWAEVATKMAAMEEALR